MKGRLRRAATRPAWLPFIRIWRIMCCVAKRPQKGKHMSKQWNPGGGFPSPEQVERMVAAEVRHLAEAEYARQRGIEEKSESRRDRLRAAYRLQHR